eukprot:498490-Pyramimonas_sp.AAC.1
MSPSGRACMLACAFSKRTMRLEKKRRLGGVAHVAVDYYRVAKRIPSPPACRPPELSKPK